METNKQNTQQIVGVTISHLITNTEALLKRSTNDSKEIENVSQDEYDKSVKMLKKLPKLLSFLHDFAQNILVGPNPKYATVWLCRQLKMVYSSNTNQTEIFWYVADDWEQFYDFTYLLQKFVNDNNTPKND